jgi:hypothetical protein
LLDVFLPEVFPPPGSHKKWYLYPTNYFRSSPQSSFTSLSLCLAKVSFGCQLPITCLQVLFLSFADIMHIKHQRDGADVSPLDWLSHSVATEWVWGREKNSFMRDNVSKHQFFYIFSFLWVGLQTSCYVNFFKYSSLWPWNTSKN